MSSTSVPNLALQRTNANNSCRVLPQNEIMQFKSLSNGSQRWTLCQEPNGSITSTSEHYWTGHVPSKHGSLSLCKAEDFLAMYDPNVPYRKNQMGSPPLWSIFLPARKARKGNHTNPEWQVEHRNYTQFRNKTTFSSYSRYKAGPAS